MQGFARQVLALALAGVLPACSVTTPVRLAAPQREALPSELAVDPGKDPASDLAHFTKSFESRLAASGINIRADAEYRLTITLAAQRSVSGVTSDPGKNAKLIEWRSKPRKRSIFDGCDPQRLRAVVIGSKGLTAYTSLHAEAELDTCKSRQMELDRLAAALAEAIINR